MSRRLTAIASLIGLMSVTSIPPASAMSAASAVCAVGITFRISSPYVGLDLGGADFTFEGSGTCVSTLGGEIITRTTIFGEGNSLLWNCGLVINGGNYRQYFENDLRDITDGRFALAGENVGMAFVVEGLPWVAVGELTTTDVVKAGTCPLTRIGTINMVGVVELQDPEA